MGKFIKQLTNKEIEQFLSDNNYTLCNGIISTEGTPLPAIERSDDLIFIRCQRILEEGENEINKALAYALLKKYPNFIAIPMLSRFGEYSTDIDLITMTDFFANLICEMPFGSSERSEKLYENYINFMRNRFKDQNYDAALLEDFEKSKENQSMNFE